MFTFIRSSGAACCCVTMRHNSSPTFPVNFYFMFTMFTVFTRRFETRVGRESELVNIPICVYQLIVTGCPVSARQNWPPPTSVTTPDSFLTSLPSSMTINVPTTRFTSIKPCGSSPFL